MLAVEAVVAGCAGFAGAGAEGCAGAELVTSGVVAGCGELDATGGAAAAGVGSAWKIGIVTLPGRPAGGAEGSDCGAIATGSGGKSAGN